MPVQKKREVSYSFNPYFTGLPILIIPVSLVNSPCDTVSILILLDYLFLYDDADEDDEEEISFNPYFTGLPILIMKLSKKLLRKKLSFNPYFTGLPILICPVSWFCPMEDSFNPYFTGLPILIKRSINEKNES